MASKGKQQEEGGAASSEAMDEDGSAAADRQVGEGEAGDETAADYYFDSYAHYGAFAPRLLPLPLASSSSRRLLKPSPPSAPAVVRFHPICTTCRHPRGNAQGYKQNNCLPKGHRGKP